MTATPEAPIAAEERMLDLTRQSVATLDRIIDRVGPAATRPPASGGQPPRAQWPAVTSPGETPMPFVRVQVYAPGGEDTLDVFLNAAFVAGVRPCPHDGFGPHRWEVWLTHNKMLAVGEDDAQKVCQAVSDRPALKRVVRVANPRTGGHLFLSTDHIRHIQVVGDECAVYLTDDFRVTVTRDDADAIARRAAPELEVVAASKTQERATK